MTPYSHVGGDVFWKKKSASFLRLGVLHFTQLPCPLSAVKYVFLLQAKKEIYDVKQQRLYLAQDEYNHLHNALTTLNTSRTSCKYIVNKVFNCFMLCAVKLEISWNLLSIHCSFLIVAVNRTECL